MERERDLRDKARRAFYDIKRNINFNIPIRIWLKILESVIELIALYGCEVWGPLTNQDFTKSDYTDPHPLRLHRSTKNSKTNPILINSHIYWVKCHSVPSQQQDL